MTVFERKTSNTQGWVRLGGMVISIVFGGLLLWSVAAPFEGAVIAPGSLTVETNHKSIQHLEGGIVSEILVSEDDTVSEGGLLLKLDATSLNAALAGQEAILVEAIATEARLIAERDGEPELRVRTNLGELTEDPRFKAALQDQFVLMQTRLRSRETQADILHQRSLQLRQKLIGLNGQLAASGEQNTYIVEELGVYEDFYEEQLVSRDQVLSLRREAANLKERFAALRAEIASTEIEIGETEIRLLEEEESFREVLLSELSQVSAEVNAALEQRTSLLDQIRRTEIRAPTSGRVLGARAHTIGGVIAPGETIMSLVPADDKLFASVRINPQDIDKVFVGQSAKLRFSAFSQSETPEVSGRVHRVSADVLQDEISGQYYYMTLLELPDGEIPNAIALVPGMPVQAMLRTESRSVLSYLTKPVSDVLSRTFRE